MVRFLLFLTKTVFKITSPNSLISFLQFLMLSDLVRQYRLVLPNLSLLLSYH